VKAVGVTRTVAYVCWLLSDFSDQCGDIAPNLFQMPHYFNYEILISKERNYRVVAELINFVFTYFLPLVLLFLCALLLTVVGLLCIGLLSFSAFLLLHVYCSTMCVLLS